MYKERVVLSIIEDNHLPLSILNYLDGCSFDAAERLREDTWGEKMEGATAPFPLEQFTLKTVVSPEEVRRSIIFRLKANITAAILSERGKQRLYIGSRTYIKVNRGLITGLPQGKMGTMCECFVSLWDWLKLGSRMIGPNFSKILLELMKEKGVEPPDTPIISGETLTHRLPLASDDRVGLAGSINMISTRVIHNRLHVGLF